MKLNTIAIGALGGFITAFLVDFQAWKSWDDAQFNIGVASFRWVQGLIIGASVAAGYGQ